MSKKVALPDAWDDEWVNGADVGPIAAHDVGTAALTVFQKPEALAADPVPKLTKAQRKAQHQELQKQLWDSAENPARNHWLETQGVVPLKQEFKPQVTLLSRKPAPSIARKADPANGVADLSLEDEGDDSEEEARKKREADFEERQKRAKLEREQKQRKYAEARERIMGTSTPASPAANSRESSQGRDARKPRARLNGNKMSQPTSTDQSPARLPPGTTPTPGLLFDPDDEGRKIPKPTTPSLDGPMRQPRGPNTNGRGGFGFVARDGKAPA